MSVLNVFEVAADQRGTEEEMIFLYVYGFVQTEQLFWFSLFWSLKCFFVYLLYNDFNVCVSVLVLKLLKFCSF